MPVTARNKKSAKTHWREVRIELEGKLRPNGSLFVTSTNLTPFSAVLEDGNWDNVIPFLKRFLEVNYGGVGDLRLIRDASELLEPSSSADFFPPAYIIAELTTQRVGTD